MSDDGWEEFYEALAVEAEQEAERRWQERFIDYD